MTTTPAPELDLKTIAAGLVKQAIIWGPIVVGVIHQFLMYFLGIERIYIVLDPPGFIHPFASLEFGWWLILTLLSSILCILAYGNRIRPHRLVYPFYAYIVFLLILVKPV